MRDYEFEVLIENARVVTCSGPKHAPPAERLAVIDRGGVAIRGDRIAWVGKARELGTSRARRIIDAGQRILLPGLIDPHTHLIFAGSRIPEYARRMRGEDYRKIAAEGGGIRSTVRATRDATDEALTQSALARARAIRRHGVTTIEVKSGYGLNPTEELRLLNIARALRSTVRVARTFLGAHAIGPEYEDDRERYVRDLVELMIPEVVRQRAAEACDVYLDEGAFSAQEARVILTAARDAGLKTKAHVGQFADLGGAELLSELGGLSCDHLEEVSDVGLRAMADAGVCAVLLPGAWRTLRQTPPNAARMRRLGVRIAIGSDANPGTSPTSDLPLCAALAVRDAGLSLEEAVLGVTAEAAGALGLNNVGMIAPGMKADLALYDEEDPCALAYVLGGISARTVILGGEVVVESPASVALW